MRSGRPSLFQDGPGLTVGLRPALFPRDALVPLTSKYMQTDDDPSLTLCIARAKGLCSGGMLWNGQTLGFLAKGERGAC